MVVFIEWYENEGETSGVDLNVREFGHHFSARSHNVGQGHCEAFNGFFDRQGAGMGSMAG
jgi:hypothetical protein